MESDQFEIEENDNESKIDSENANKFSKSEKVLLNLVAEIIVEIILKEIKDEQE